MKLFIFFVVMATLTAGVERLLSRVSSNEGDLHGGGWEGRSCGADDA